MLQKKLGRRIAELRRAGVKGYLRKPCTPEALRDALNKIDAQIAQTQNYDAAIENGTLTEVVEAGEVGEVRCLTSHAQQRLRASGQAPARRRRRRWRSPAPSCVDRADSAC